MWYFRTWHYGVSLSPGCKDEDPGSPGSPGGPGKPVSPTGPGEPSKPGSPIGPVQEQRRGDFLTFISASTCTRTLMHE